MRITIDISAQELREVMDMDSVPVLPLDMRNKLIDCIQEIDRALDNLGDLEV